MEKEICIHFNLEKELDKRIYYAIKNLPSFYGDGDVSEALISFINDIVISILECEELKEKCEKLQKHFSASNLWN
jgi:hypothetical protein